MKQWAPADNTRYKHSPDTSPLFHVETPNTVTSISRHRVREHPQQLPRSLLGERYHTMVQTNTSSLEEASGVELLCTLSNLRECSGTRCLGPHLCYLSTAR